MFQYTNHELAIVIAVPIIVIILLWTLVIFHKNKRRWRAFDIVVVAVLSVSVLRNVAIVTYIAVLKLEVEALNFDICSAFVWTFNSIHTFQASCLTTLAVIGVFSIKLYRKQQSLKNYLTATHVIYHLFCLTTLCACVGVAGILAKQEMIDFNLFKVRNCKFMPYQLDMKFNAFIVVLHVFLTAISFCAFLYICFIYFRMKRGGFDYLKKSTSDLSELSLSTVPTEQNKSYYDTYTIQRNNSYGQYDSQAPLNGYNTIWKSDMSNVSTTVSSTNSRRPLNNKENHTPARQNEDGGGTGLETIHPVLMVCYLFYHIPIIVLCVFPSIIAPIPVATAALWLGLLQDVLIPIGLGLVDSRFNNWVSNVYQCSSKKDVEGKLPHVGLDGKFRHFGSQPQSLETNQMLPERVPARCFPNAAEHKFPITNGSLYTSIDGRVPVIHNYRRHNNETRAVKLENNLGIHSSNLKRNEVRKCNNCDKPHCSSSMNLSFSSNSDLIRNSVYNLNINRGQLMMKPYLRHISLSQNSLRQIPLGNPLGESRDYTMSTLSLDPAKRLSKSYDSLNELTKFKNDSDEEYFTDGNRNFDTMSTESSYSITTEANCDFEFYQNDKEDFNKKPKNPANFKIKRSNSKRSLENLQAYVDEAIYKHNLQKSNSFMSTLERRKPINVSVEFLHNNREGTFLDLPSARPSRRERHASVPDLKQIFISEYI